MRRLLLFAFLLLSGTFATTAKSTTWEKLFSAAGTDVFRSVQEVPSGGYIAAGYTSDINVNDTDAYVAKLNLAGDTAWTFKYNGPMSFKDLLYKVIPTMDGGFAFCGYSSSFTGISDDVMIMKLNASGQLQWVKHWGGNGRDRAQDILELPNGNFAIVGYTTSAPAQYYDAFMLLTDNQGNLINSKLYGSFGYDDANALQSLPDGGFILGGQSYNGAQGLDQFLIRLNSAMDTLWTRKFGTPYADNIESLLTVSDGFVIAGNTGTLTTGDDGSLVKTDTSGTVIWSKTFGGTLADDFHTVKAASGGFIACGTTRSYGQLNPNIWLMKMNASGDSVWAQTYGGDNHDHGYSAFEATDGGYVVVGHTGSFGWNLEEAMIIKTDSVGMVDNKLKYSTVIALLEPVSSVCGGPNTQVKVVIKNFGEVNFTHVPITVEVSGDYTGTLNQIFPLSFEPGKFDTVTFSAVINTAGIGTYTFHCYTSTDNDVYPLRNSFTTTLTMEGYAPAPMANDVSRCGPGNVTITAVSVSPIQWFTAATGGSSVHTGNTFVTPAISTTTTYYVQSGLNCPSSRVPVVASILSSSVDPITASAEICGPGTVTLSASSQDTVRWYDSATGSNMVGTGNSFTTPLLSSSATFWAQSGYGVCITNRVPANVTVHVDVVDPVVTSNQRCGPGTLTLMAASPDLILWFDSPLGGNIIGSGNSIVTPPLSSTTIYYAQTLNSNCQSPRVPVQAEIFIVPAVNLGNDTILSNATSLMLIAGSGINSYLWSTGEVSESISVTTSGLYCVTVTSAQNCSNSDCILVDFTTGLTDIPIEKAVTVYPNPTIGKCTVSIPAASTFVNIELIDLRGAVVNRYEGAQVTEIDLTPFPKGIYWLRIISESYSGMQKIVLM